MKRSVFATLGFCALGTLASLTLTPGTVLGHDDGSAPPPPGAAPGQGKQEGKGDGKHETKRDPMMIALEKLDLSKDQWDKINVIIADAKAKMKQYYLEHRESGSKEEMGKAMMAIHEEARRKIEAVLTEDQLRKFRQLMDDFHDKRKGRHEPPATQKGDDARSGSGDSKSDGPKKGDGWEPSK